MSRKHLCRSPHYVSDRIWWYEEMDGMLLVVESDAGLPTTTHNIKWQTIRTALRRKDRKP